MSKKIEKVIIIGSGPAGHTAAIYAARANLEPLLFEGFMAGGVAAGGQLTTTTDVENYPGFPEGISGPELMDKMRAQGVRYGTRVITETVDSVDLKAEPKRVLLGDEEYFAETIIIATGATAKKLDLIGGEELWQKGISACAVCDGALPIFRDKPLAVIGGGDSACEEINYLTKFGSSVHMLVRRNVLRASKTMQQRVLRNSKIRIHWNTNATEVMPTEVDGRAVLGGVKFRNNVSGVEDELAVSGLFFAIGHIPNTAFLDGQLETDESGYLITKPNATATAIPGVFACGDVQDKIYRQAVTAAGSGCMAALEAEHYLAARE